MFASIAARVALPAAALGVAHAADLDTRDTLILTASSAAAAMVFDWVVLGR